MGYILQEGDEEEEEGGATEAMSSEEKERREKEEGAVKGISALQADSGESTFSTTSLYPSLLLYMCSLLFGQTIY